MTIERDPPAPVGVQRQVRPLAVRLAQQLQTAAYSHGYEDGHPSNATTRQDKYSALSQRLRNELQREIEELLDGATCAERLRADTAADALRFRWLCENPDWHFIERLCREVSADSSMEFLADLRRVIDARRSVDLGPLEQHMLPGA